METTVVNISKGEANTRYIGRPGHGEQGYFGNPIKFRETCEICGLKHQDTEDGRKALLACYKIWLWKKVNTDRHYLKRMVTELKGEALGCFCHPKPCHGHVIKDFLDWTDTPKGKAWLDEKLSAPTITVKDWVEGGKKERVAYNGEEVKSAYRDPSYKDIERYVISLAGIGYGSKKPDSKLQILEAK